MDKKKLDVITKKAQAAKHNNVIIECMRLNSMTLENLDDACAIVKEVFRKDAMLKGPTEADPNI